MFIYPPTITNSTYYGLHISRLIMRIALARLEDVLVYTVQGHDRTFEHPFRGPVL